MTVYEDFWHFGADGPKVFEEPEICQEAQPRCCCGGRGGGDIDGRFMAETVWSFCLPNLGTPYSGLHLNKSSFLL